MARHSTLTELLLALLIAVSVACAYGALGGKVEMTSKLSQWGRALVADARHARTPAAAPDARSARDPFLAATKAPGPRFHPFIDFSGTAFPDRRDYFGFRNDFDAYFHPGDYRYIVMTGGSEVAGEGHAGTIARTLERILNIRSGRGYRVLNLGMNGATSANEINYFANLAFALHPRFVISHGFVDDMISGYQAPPEFQVIGMFFPYFERRWPSLVEVLSLDPRMAERILVPANTETHLLTGFRRNLERYAAVAQASGARFLFGLQKFGDADAAQYARFKRIYESVLALEREHRLGVEMIDFNSDPRIRLAPGPDPARTTEESLEPIAELYAARILAEDREP